jgi:purine nucleosidase/pyrimidine-specific ribonucleoside hydrolase
MRPQPVLLDVDTGVDDALAIMLALRSPELEVVGISTVSGNVSLEACTRNTLLVLDHLEAPPIPVAAGAAGPLARAPRHAASVHGGDGLGDLPVRPAASRRRASSDAVAMLLQTIDRLGGGLVVVATGPLTNIAQALQKDPDRLRRLKGLTVMGGAVAVPGNVTPAAEFNFWADPEAAALVVGAGLPLTVVPLDVTERVVLERSMLEDAAARGPGAAFVQGIARVAMAFHRRTEGIDGMYVHDPLAVATVVEPSLVVSERMPLAVECHGELTTGALVADRRRRRRTEGDAAAATAVCLDVDVARFHRLFHTRVLGDAREV